MMTRAEVLGLIESWTSNKNLLRHMLAVEATMRAIARKFKVQSSKFKIKKEINEEKWGLAGLLHDADYELTKDNAEKEHTKKTLQWLKENGVDEAVYNAVARHAWGFVEGAPKPETKMDWALYCGDELTGFIVAVSLVRPDKKLSSVTVDSVLKKWKEKSFAAGVKRDQIELCEEKLGIPLSEFIGIALGAMQGISKDLGL